MSTSIHFIAKIFEKLQPYIPLMQTLVLPIVILLVILIYKKNIISLLESITDLIKNAASIKIGSVFEVRSASLAEKLEKQRVEQPEIIGKSAKTSAFGDSDLYTKVSLAEKLAIGKLSTDLNLTVRPEARVCIDGRTSSYIFDGVAMEGKKLIGFEVKYIRAEKSLSIVEQTMSRINAFYESITNENRKYFSLILVIVFDQNIPNDTGILTHKLSMKFKQLSKMPVHIVIYHLDDLKEEIPF